MRHHTAHAFLHALVRNRQAEGKRKIGVGEGAGRKGGSENGQGGESQAGIGREIRGVERAGREVLADSMRHRTEREREKQAE